MKRKRQKTQNKKKKDRKHRMKRIKDRKHRIKRKGERKKSPTESGRMPKVFFAFVRHCLHPHLWLWSWVVPPATIVNHCKLYYINNRIVNDYLGRVTQGGHGKSCTGAAFAILHSLRNLQMNPVSWRFYSLRFILFLIYHGPNKLQCLSLESLSSRE